MTSENGETRDTGILNEYAAILYESFENEGERTILIVGVAYLDSALETLLRNYFVDRPTRVKSLLRQDGPLGSFKARMDLAYCLGLLTDEEHHDLNILRQVRNDFAHNPKACLDDHSDRCRDLQMVNRLVPELRADTHRSQVMLSLVELGSWLRLRALSAGRTQCQVRPPVRVKRMGWPPA